MMMRAGCWSSEAFFEYIREKVEDFTVGVSEIMIRFKYFFTMNRNSTPQELSTNNENGPDTVDFYIEFSQLTLSGDNGRFRRNGITE